MRKRECKLPDGETTVGANNATSQVRSLVRKQENGGVSLLVRLREAAHGDTGSLEVADLGVHSTGLLSVAETGLENVDTDTVLGPLGSETLAKVGGSTLGRVVEDLGQRLVKTLLVVNLGRHGRGDDDGTLLEARLDPELSDSLGRVEDTEDVGVVNVTEVIGGEFDSGLDDGNTGVGEETSNLSEFVLSLLERLLDELGITDIALISPALNTELLGNLGGSLLSLGMGSVEDGDVGTGVGNSLGHGETCKRFERGKMEVIVVNVRCSGGEECVYSVLLLPSWLALFQSSDYSTSFACFQAFLRALRRVTGRPTRRLLQTKLDS